MSNLKNTIFDLGSLPETMTEYLRRNFDDIQMIITLYETRSRKHIKELSKKNNIIGETVYETIINLMKLEGIEGYSFSMESVRTTMSRLRDEKGLLKHKESKKMSQSVVINDNEKPQTASSRSLINEDKRTENVKVQGTMSQVSQATPKEDLETFLKNVKLTDEEKNKIEIELNYFQTFKKANIGSVNWDENDDIILQVFQFLSNKTNQKCEIFKKQSYSINDLLLSRLTSYVKSDGSKFYSKCKKNNKDTTWWE